jgi:hypothetical protein
MRILPKAPSLEYLKQQAKDLLDAIRESRPAAHLTDAQAMLARQYGFEAWTELKREVEARRDAREFADAALTAAIASVFDLGAPTAPATIVARELSCDILRVETDSGRWMARTLLPWMTEEQLAAGNRLREAAAAVGMRTPTPRRVPSGALSADLEGQRWRVDVWTDLGPSIVKPLSSAVARRIGIALGTIHRLRLTPSQPIGAWIGQRRPPERWPEILEIVRGDDAPWTPLLEAALPTIQDLATIATQPPGEMILSHGDLVSGIRTARDAPPTVLGWEFAGATPPDWDLGMVLHACTETPTGEVNATVVPAIIDGYASASGVKPSVDLSTFAAAINAWDSWVVSRMNIALGDGPDREEASTELRMRLGAPLSRSRLEQILAAAS